MRLVKTISAAAFCAVMASIAAPAVAAWQDELNDFDRARLGLLDQSRDKGLAKAARGSQNDLATIRGVLGPSGGPISGRELEGDWLCRQMKLGGMAPSIVYTWFNCRVRQTRYGLYFEKHTGTELMSGYLEPYENGRMVLMGAITVGEQRPKPYSGGNVGAGAIKTSNDAVGIVSSMGPGHARIGVPFPVIESDFDVMELRRGGGASGHSGAAAAVAPSTRNRLRIEEPRDEDLRRGDPYGDEPDEFGIR